MRILIYGAGALGQALGCMLAVAGHRVDLVLRRRFIEAIRTQGLALSGLFGNYVAAPATLGLAEDVAWLAPRVFGHRMELGPVKLLFKEGGRRGRVVQPWEGCPWPF